METIFQIDSTLNIPIYQQMANSIRTAVRKGILPHGHQLPTVQELSEKLNLARGTVIRAYNALEQEGLVEKTQGRGTFVRCPHVVAGSRKDRAMDAIDAMLDQLEAMGFSPGEISIFLNLKFRERTEEDPKVKIALIECNPETLSQIAKQLQNIPSAELYSYLLNTIVQNPYNLEESIDLVVTTQAHAQELVQLLAQGKHVSPIALQLTTECMVAIIKLGRWDKVGILCQSQRFGQLLQSTCRLYAEEAAVCEPLLISQEEALEAYLKDKLTLLVPEGLEDHCSLRVKELLEQFHGQIIHCGYRLDNGSYLYIQERAKRILASKTI